MYCRVLACDFDGTGATDGRLAPELAAALGAARAQGLVTLLVTGRVHEEVEHLCSDLSMFDAVVAENGAVVCLPGGRRTLQLCQPPSVEFLGALRARGVPFQTGAVVVGTWEQHAGDALQVIRDFGLDAQLTFNRSAMMLLPSGINKAVGVRRALEELGRSAHNLIAFGDAENDLPLFAMAEVAVAAYGAVPSVAARADERLSKPGGAGVADYIYRLLAQGGIVPTPARHSLILGTGADGAPVMLASSGINVMITGDPRSGKSWLAGLVAEQLIEREYRVCVIDPEGDYLALGQRPRVLVLGHQIGLPEPALVPRLWRDEPISLVINLASLSQSAQTRYVHALLAEVESMRAITGIPHWILIDEAQYFFHNADCAVSVAPTGNYLFSTYRPSLVCGGVFAAVQAHLITHTAVEEERYFITSLLQARGPRDVLAGDALAQVLRPGAGLLLEDPERPRWQVFTPSQRATAHAHHARKYSDTSLPEHQAFRFLYADGRASVAHNVMEFHGIVQTLPMSSLRHHLNAGDFSRWVSEVLGDEQLARGLRKLERAVAAGASPDREEILAHIEDHYLIQPVE